MPINCLPCSSFKLEPLFRFWDCSCNTSFHLPERSSLLGAHCGPESANVIYSPDSNCTTIPIVIWARESNKLPIQIATQKRPLLWPYPLRSNLDLGGTSVASDVPLNSILESKATVRRDKPLRFNPKGKKNKLFIFITTPLWCSISARIGGTGDVKWMRKLCRRSHPSSRPPIAHP